MKKTTMRLFDPPDKYGEVPFVAAVHTVFGPLLVLQSTALEVLVEVLSEIKTHQLYYSLNQKFGYYNLNLKFGYYNLNVKFGYYNLNLKSAIKIYFL